MINSFSLKYCASSAWAREVFMQKTSPATPKLHQWFPWIPTALNHGCRAACGGQVSLSTLIGWPLATYSVPVPPRLEFNALLSKTLRNSFCLRVLSRQKNIIKNKNSLANYLSDPFSHRELQHDFTTLPLQRSRARLPEYILLKRCLLFWNLTFRTHPE